MILLSVPLALSGGIWILYLLDYNLSIAVASGFIALAGLAVETSVVMLMYLNEAYENVISQCRQAGRGPTAEEIRNAVKDGAILRLRPIVMTVTTVIVGLLPVMLGSGTGSEVMRRIAAPMVGGVVSATLLTLLVLPAMYLLWRQAGQRWAADPAVALLDRANQPSAAGWTP